VHYKTIIIYIIMWLLIGKRMDTVVHCVIRNHKTNWKKGGGGFLHPQICCFNCAHLYLLYWFCCSALLEFIVYRFLGYHDELKLFKNCIGPIQVKSRIFELSKGCCQTYASLISHRRRRRGGCSRREMPVVVYEFKIETFQHFMSYEYILIPYVLD